MRHRVEHRALRRGCSRPRPRWSRGSRLLRIDRACTSGQLLQFAFREGCKPSPVNDRRAPGRSLTRTLMTLNVAADTTVLDSRGGPRARGRASRCRTSRTPALIPVAGRPVIHWTMSYLRSLGLPALRHRGRPARRVHRRLRQLRIRQPPARLSSSRPRRQGGLGQTVADLARAVRTPRALVVLGDTHFQFADPARARGCRRPPCW